MWCGDCTLKEAFPDLYCLSRARDSSVAEVMCWTSGRIHWNFQFHCSLQDWKEVSFDRFTAIGSQQGVEVLRSEVSIFLSTPYYLLPLEVGVAIKGPSRGGFLLMVNLFR